MTILSNEILEKIKVYGISLRLSTNQLKFRDF